jgi:hypothetical protein
MKVVYGITAHNCALGDIFPKIVGKTVDKILDKETIDYAKKINIPEEQLDFPIFGL